MKIAGSHDSCPTCSSRSAAISNQTSIWGTLFVIILPKCPFCVMAYTSAISICGGPDMYLASNNWISYIPLALCLVILAMVFLNWRGKRSFGAIALITVGTTLIVSTHQLLLSPEYYHVGSFLLFMGIWLNGSLLAFGSYLNGLRRKFLFVKS